MNVNIFLHYFTKINNVGVFNNKSCDSKLDKKIIAIAFEMFIFDFMSKYFITWFTMICHL